MRLEVQIKKMKAVRWDTCLLLLLMLIGIFFSVWIYLPASSPGGYLEIRQNGKPVKTIPLGKDCEETIRSEDGETNTFSIKNGKVSMTDANCGDQTCIHTGSISHNGETIVCLPHRLVLKICADDEKDRSTEPDIIVH